MVRKLRPLELTDKVIPWKQNAPLERERRLPWGHKGKTNQSFSSKKKK